MPEDLHISAASIEDAPSMLAIQRSAFRLEAELNGVNCIAPLSQDLASLLADVATHRYLKAELSGSLVGLGRARLEGGTCHIGRLAVAPELHGRGIGRALLEALEGLFPEARRFELFTGQLSARNIRLYEAAGYRIFKHEPGPPAMVFMEKPAQLPS